MTEPERIIKQGVLPESFLKEEIRDGFLVTEDRKKLWAILLDLLLKFDEVCKKHKLKYSLAFGSILGAVRHNGFIPWDDDIDVCMPRDDYEKLIKLAGEFKNPYFLQTPYSDKHSAYSWAKLRNSNTTMASKHFVYNDMDHGILIDIFPYDKWDYNDNNAFEVIKYLALENSTYMRLTNPNLDDNNKKRVRNWAGIDSLNVYNTIQKIARKYHNIETDYILFAVCTIYGYNKMLMYKVDYDEIIYKDFEGFKFPIPKGYDRILKTVYGDYMEFPPVENRGQWHSDLIIDTDVPFKDHIANIVNN